MKIIFLLGFVFCVVNLRSQESIYTLSFNTMEGNKISMDRYMGKPFFVVVLSGTINKSDSSMLSSIADFVSQRQLNIIAVPSIEDGYKPQNEKLLADWYRKYLGKDVVIGKAMSTRKTSVTQDDLFAWLTQQEKNSHFDMDVEGAGQKFFINRRGVLSGVFVPQTSFSEILIQRALTINNNSN